MDNNSYQPAADDRDTATRAADDHITTLNVQPSVDDVEFGSGWYHDVAITEAKQAPARQQ